MKSFYIKNTSKLNVLHIYFVYFLYWEKPSCEVISVAPLLRLPENPFD